MSNAIKIRVGGFYLKGRGYAKLVRQVEDRGENNIYWRDFDYVDGQPIGTGVCSERTFEQWAGRELTSTEVAELFEKSRT